MKYVNKKRARQQNTKSFFLDHAWLFVVANRKLQFLHMAAQKPGKPKCRKVKKAKNPKLDQNNLRLQEGNGSSLSIQRGRCRWWNLAKLHWISLNLAENWQNTLNLAKTASNLAEKNPKEVHLWCCCRWSTIDYAPNLIFQANTTITLNAEISKKLNHIN